MSPRKTEQPSAPGYLKFVGRADYFVSGVPQANLLVVNEPKAADQVSPETALDILATGLYLEMTADEYEAEKPKAAEAAQEDPNG